MSNTSFTDKARRIGSIMIRILRHILLHNGWVKLLAVMISLVLWAGLISQDESLTREKTWQNVNVSVSGSETMKRNHFIVVSDLDELLDNVSVTAAVPQKQYEQADSSAYNIRVDLSRISGTGPQELKIISTASNTYGKVTNTVPSVINVEVEEYMVRQRLPVSVTVTGEYQNGWYKDWYMPNPSVDPALIAVSGPSSLVKTISRAKVDLDPESFEWKEGTFLTTGEISLYNRAGEKVSSPLLGITTESLSIDTVLIEANILPAKTFDVLNLIEYQGEVSPGYRIVSKKVSPESITIAARGEVLEQMEELPLDRIVNLQNISETTVFQLKVQKPSDDAVLSNETVTVTVEVTADET
ncbi:MAG: hypothetical protein IKQ45_06685 [Clostridia bacterium]|nr:hypothetical protein [Clostridia bacterium]